MLAKSIDICVNGSPSPVAYTLRSLCDDESDIRRWAEFCAFCFGDKPNPPTTEYFERHFFNDPWRDASAIHIIEFEGDDGKADIASSMRVFRRTISDGQSGTMEAGGVGEVCTHPDHRRRGLSKILLEKSIAFMESCGMETSLLHAGAAVTPVYKKNGNYDCTKSRWSVVKMDRAKLCAPDEGYSVRLAVFPADTEALLPLHKVYSEDRFAGCIVRTRQYWNEYLREEIGNSLFVLAEGGVVVAWLSIRPRSGRFQLREFGINRECVGATQAISVLLRKALEKESSSEIHFLLPTSVLDDVKNGDTKDVSTFILWDEGVQEEDDIGWMYRPIVKKDSRSGMVEIAKGGEHLIWPADSF